MFGFSAQMIESRLGREHHLGIGRLADQEPYSMQIESLFLHSVFHTTTIKRW